MISIGYVTAKQNRPPAEIAVIAEFRGGKWWCSAPGNWGARGPVWVECEIVEEKIT